PLDLDEIPHRRFIEDDRKLFAVDGELISRAVFLVPERPLKSKARKQLDRALRGSSLNLNLFSNLYYGVGVANGALEGDPASPSREANPQGASLRQEGVLRGIKQPVVLEVPRHNDLQLKAGVIQSAQVITCEFHLGFNHRGGTRRVLGRFHCVFSGSARHVIIPVGPSMRQTGGLVIGHWSLSMCYPGL